MSPHTSAASVIVGSVPPRSYAAGPGVAPADRGPTVSAPTSSSATIDPPPTAMLCDGRPTGTRTTWPATWRWRAMAGAPPSTKATSVLVPPMSNATACSIPVRRARWLTAATPAAGPDMTVRSGSSLTAPVGSIPPEDPTTNSCASGSARPIASESAPT